MHPRHIKTPAIDTASTLLRVEPKKFEWRSLREGGGFGLAGGVEGRGYGEGQWWKSAGEGFGTRDGVCTKGGGSKWREV